MQKTVLIAGKEVPLGAAISMNAKLTERNVIVTTTASAKLVPTILQSKAPPADASIIDEIPWNRGSAIAARSLILRGERLFGSIQEVVLIFDTSIFITSYQDITAVGCSRVIDTLMAGYLYLTSETLRHFKRNQSGSIIFIHRTDPTQVPNIPVRMAEQAFISLAEETSKSCRNLPWKSLLIRADTENDEDIAQWLFPYVDAQSKNQGKWIKALSKPGLFSLL